MNRDIRRCLSNRKQYFFFRQGQNNSRTGKICFLFFQFHLALFSIGISDRKKVIIGIRFYVMHIFSHNHVFPYSDSFPVIGKVIRIDHRAFLEHFTCQDISFYLYIGTSIIKTPVLYCRSDSAIFIRNISNGSVAFQVILQIHGTDLFSRISVDYGSKTIFVISTAILRIKIRLEKVSSCEHHNIFIIRANQTMLSENNFFSFGIQIWLNTVDFCVEPGIFRSDRPMRLPTITRFFRCFLSA